MAIATDSLKRQYCSSSPSGRPPFGLCWVIFVARRRSRGPIWDDLLRLSLPDGRTEGSMRLRKGHKCTQGGGVHQGAVPSGTHFRSLLTSSALPFVTSVRMWNWHRPGASLGNTPRPQRTARGARKHVNMRVNSMSPNSLSDRSTDTPGPLLESQPVLPGCLFRVKVKLQERSEKGRLPGSEQGQWYWLPGLQVSPPRPTHMF